MRARSLLAALTAAVTLGSAGAGIAYADALNFTSDGVAPISGNLTVKACTNQATKFDVLVAATRIGAADGNTFADGSQVGISITSVAAPLTATLNKTSITLPSDWSSQVNKALSTDMAKLTVTLPAQAASGSGSARLDFAGVNAAGGSVTGHNNLGLSWTVSQCDTTPPTLHLPGDLTVEATSAAGATVSYTATADDAAPAHPTVTCTPASGTTFPMGATDVSCSATDAAGNTATGSFTVTVQDTTAPVISNLPNDISLEATGASTGVSWSQPTAVDSVSGSRDVTCTPASGSSFPVGTTPVTCTATDAAGNTATASFKVTISDTTKPVLTLPTGITAEATGPSGAAVSYDASAADLVDGSITPACQPPSGSTFALGTTTVNCTATDAAGNVASGSFPVKVQDTTPPTLTVPDPMTVEATGPDGAAATFTVTATDLVDGNVLPDCTAKSGATFPITTTTVTCTATDNAGNSSAKSFTITVRDTTPPSITVPDNQVLEATGPNGATATFTATAVDLVDGTFDATCTPASGSIFPLGSTQVDCSAMDKHGNLSDTKSFAVIVQDTTPPSMTLPADITAEATGPDGATVSYATSATDLVDGAVVPSCTPASGSVFPLGATTVSCSATDAHGNTASGSFSVNVVDTTPPVITWVSPTEGSSYLYGSMPTPSCTAVDLVSGSVPCTVNTPDPTVGTHTLTATATDAAGNTATAKRSYTVLAWTLKGFFQPVDMNGVINTVKAGSTVPLKFQIFSGSTELTNVSAVKSFTTKTISCSSVTTALTDDVEVTSTGGTSLRYDSTGDQFIQNWQTPKAAGTCYQATMTAQDGSSISALFKLK